MTTESKSDQRLQATAIEVFRAGTHVDASGRRLAFSDSDVAAIAASYDPALHEAPIVVGHPRDDAPAYGWVGGLTADGGMLRADAHQVDPGFAEIVNAGRFKRVSISLYAPDSPANPKPGGWYLRHVGFLGAQPPAVKGLKPVAFAGSDEGVVELSETWTLGLVARLFRSLREMLIGQFGQEAADRALPADTIDTVADAGPIVPPAAGTPLYAEPQTQEDPPVADTTHEAQLAERERRILAEEQRLAADRATFAEERAAMRATEDAAFLDRMVAEARLPADARPLAAALLARADAIEVASFADVAETERGALRQLIERLPPAVAFGETAPATTITVADPRSPASIEAAADALIKARADAGQTLTFREAVRLVVNEETSA